MDLINCGTRKNSEAQQWGSLEEVDDILYTFKKINKFVKRLSNARGPCPGLHISLQASHSFLQVLIDERQQRKTNDHLCLNQRYEL